MKKIAIQCKNIEKRYGQGRTLIKALRGINLAIFSGELTLLVGPSGSGKTTLLSIITSILTPDEGELHIDGRDVLSMSTEEKALFNSLHVGIVFQSLYLIPSLTVLENVTLPLLVTKVPESKAYRQGMEILEKLHIEKYATFSPAEMSKGQQQRVAIARALIHDPSIIVCDEPTSALDHNAGHNIMTILHKLAQDTSKCVLVVTHDHRTFSSADRIVNIEDGQITLEECCV